MAAAREASAPSGKVRRRIPFRLRLKAWWEGYDLQLLEKDRRPRGKTAGDGDSPEEPIVFERWDDSHRALLQAVWGEGYVIPGGSEQTLQLVKPFGLNPAMSLLHLGAGLGGASRLIAKQFGVWVTGMERESVLAKSGMALSTKAGLEKKAPILPYDPEHFEGKQKTFDCIFAQEVFYTIEDKVRLFDMLDIMMKDNGQLVFTDYVLAKPKAASSVLQQWSLGEPYTPHPWTVQDYTRALTEKRLDIRITEDISEGFQRMVTAAWADFMMRHRGGMEDKRLAPALVEEVELWTRRVQALESGELRVCRIYALKKTRSNLLSDW